MKNLTYILAPVFALLILGSCQKESTTVEDPRTSYMYSMKGQTRTAIKGEVYQVLESDLGTCQGYFFKSTGEYFDFVIEISEGMSDSVLNHEDLKNMSFEMDFEFTGIAYNCVKSYKRIGDHPNGHPIEIQQVKVTRFLIND
jgi:hypothetical protein